jgi:long-chain acyl-CoA synthetase
MSKEIKTPWYAYYDGVREHLKYPKGTIYQALEESAKEHLDYISYNYYGKERTYNDFLHEIDDAARGFKQLGVKRKDIVSICMPNTPEGIISFYALNKIGAIANMIHPLSAEDEIKRFLNDTESKFIVIVDMAYNKINRIIDSTKIKNCIMVSVDNYMPITLKMGYKVTKGRKIKIPSDERIIKWRDFIANGKSYTKNIKVKGKDSDVAAILYSGGTSSFPKGVELTNLNFNASAISAIEACQNLDVKDTILAIMPIFHGFGLSICIHTVQLFGGTSILLPMFNAATFDKLIKKHKPNIIAGVPTLYEALINSKNLDGYDLSFLKLMISGGDSLSIELKHKIDNFLHDHNCNIQVREGYGLTENVSGTCLTPTNYYREGSIGIPYPDSYYKIVKMGTIEEVPYDEVGEICISGPCVMKGYFNNPKETKEALRKHKDGRVWLHTGDLGTMDKDGFIFYKQRAKRMIISSGYNLYPKYIENIIESHPDVLVSCVIGIPHPYKVEVAKAFIVLKDNHKNKDKILKEIKELCEKKLAKYSWPYEYEFREDLPRTLVGKVAYNELVKEEEKKYYQVGD